MTATGPLAADVVVAGAGPAGSAAAILLAAHGLRAVAVDKARFPRDKCCGDGLTAAALRRLEALGVRPAEVASWHPVSDVRLRSPSGTVAALRLPSDGTYAAVARRRDLDAALVAAARRAGAEVAEGGAVTAVRCGPAGVEVELSDGRRLAAPYLLACDGAWSPVRRLLAGSAGGAGAGGGDPGATAAGGGYRGDWYAFRQYVTGVTGPAAEQLWVWFEEEGLPGYVWSFPLGGGVANVGFGMPVPAGRPVADLARLWQQLRRRPHIGAALGPDAAEESPTRAWPIPASLAAGLLAGGGGRVLFAGDAARATDPLTGEGIAQALETGELAARAVIGSGPDRPAEAATRYRRAVAGGLAVDLGLAARLSSLLSHRRAARAAVRLAGWSGRSGSVFARFMFEDFPRAAPLTPWRWTAGSFRSPGAYR